MKQTSIRGIRIPEKSTGRCPCRRSEGSEGLIAGKGGRGERRLSFTEESPSRERVMQADSWGGTISHTLGGLTPAPACTCPLPVAGGHHAACPGLPFLSQVILECLSEIVHWHSSALFMSHRPPSRSAETELTHFLLGDIQRQAARNTANR